ncbi:MAG: S26 family signal peptidase [Streptosporangiaceae bacterium]
MEPALHPGDWLLAWRGLRRERTLRVRPGQLVVARHPQDPELLLVKRATILLPDGWWLASDNAAAAAVDSRRFGPVPVQMIVATVILRYRRQALVDPSWETPRGRAGEPPARPRS